VRAQILLAAAMLVAPLSVAFADDPPAIEHQPVPCTVPDKALSICASVGDDNQVAKSRVYFRPAGDDFYSFVEMVFGGLNYCGTVPGPRSGKVKSIEYYVQAMDDQFQAQRTSTYQISVQPEGVCEFPPIEKDLKRASSIRVFATNKKQGKKLPAEFQPTGVSFVPVVGN
jgi:hypothetical protein